MITELPLTELCDTAQVTPRTVRYYIQQGLLPPASRTGPGAAYTQEHLDRLLLIRQLKRQHLPLAEIRQRLDRLGSAELRALVRPADDQDSAADYISRVLARQRVATITADPDPAPGAISGGRSTWERHQLHPDVELHVRRPLSPSINEAVQKLLEQATVLLGAR